MLLLLLLVLLRSGLGLLLAPPLLLQLPLEVARTGRRAGRWVLLLLMLVPSPALAPSPAPAAAAPASAAAAVAAGHHTHTHHTIWRQSGLAEHSERRIRSLMMLVGGREGLLLWLACLGLQK
jgi:hypothetical protein